ncbi:oligosaccharide flippase family protein [Actinomyces sp. B33]|uniref:oligosaccharide flippase family protein n=1 Tax=Actinomyces sp. B33 TaxID=2942131 RepID=UPI002341EB36|nr:oligosaccharide flippase family protein [Actinomyces sp. B33]MDC4233604.1 oligosaccharide flippase family protein [Actinomyces sp. B33]
MSGDRTDRRGLARSGALGFAGAAASAGLGFALTVVLARMLGPAGSGVVTQATGVFAVVMGLTKVGLDSTSIYLLPRLRIDAPEQIRACLTFMAATTIGVSAATVLVLEAAAPLIWSAREPEVAEAVRAVVWLVPLGSLAVVAAAALRAVGSMREYVVVQNIALPGSRPLLVAAAAALSGSLALVAVAWALPFLVALVASWTLLLRRLPASASSARWPDAPRRREILSFALPRTLTAGLEQGLVWLDVLLVGALAGSAAAGVYAGASRFIQAGLIVDTALRVVVSPRFSRLLHLGRLDELDRLYSTATTWLVLFATPIHILMAVFAPALMRLLGDEFASGSAVLVVLCLGAVVTFLAGNIHSLLIMSGRSGWAAVNKAVVLVVNVVGNIVLVPRLGMIGAAAAWAACMVLDALMAGVQVIAFTGLRPRIGRAVLPLLGGLVSVGAPSAVAALIAGRDSFTGLLIGTAASAACFALMCRVMRRPLHLSGLGAVFSARRDGG